MDSLLTYLERMALLQRECGNPDKRVGWTYDCYEELVLKEGHLFQTNPRPEDVEQMEMKMCYSNSAHFALSDPERYIYCEGYGRHLIPTMHAWVVDRKTGLLIDPTWQEQEENGYYGIEVPFDFLVESLVEHGTYGVVENDWKNDCLMLRGTSVGPLKCPWCGILESQHTHRQLEAGRRFAAQMPHLVFSKPYEQVRKTSNKMSKSTQET